MVDLEIITLLTERFKSVDDSIKAFREEVKDELRAIADDKAKQEACIDGMLKDQSALKASIDKKFKCFIIITLSFIGANSLLPQESLLRLITLITKAFGGS